MRKEPHVTETVLTDEDIRRIHETDASEQPAKKKPSKGLAAAIESAKAASAAQNERSRRIVEELRQQREHNDVPKVTGGQMSISDFTRTKRD